MTLGKVQYLSVLLFSHLYNGSTEAPTSSDCFRQGMGYYINESTVPSGERGSCKYSLHLFVLLGFCVSCSHCLGCFHYYLPLPPQAFFPLKLLLLIWFVSPYRILPSFQNCNHSLMSVNKTLPTYFIRNDGVDKMRIATIFFFCLCDF